MAEGTHRCCVDGCPNLAAYRVMLYDFDPAEGAVRFTEDESCPFICVEHAIDNERHSLGGHTPHSVVRYPHTNSGNSAGLSIYLQLEPAYAA
jgi:hypothetical protein